MSAIISECGQYRYRLERDSAGAGATAIIMVNPSTADAEDDDQTIRKLQGFGKLNGWGRLLVGNLFALRATDVTQLGRVSDPIGPENARHLARILDDADRVIFAWGRISKQPKYHRHVWRALDQAARMMLMEPHCIGPVTKCGHPSHPQMLGYALPIVPWSTPA